MKRFGYLLIVALLCFFASPANAQDAAERARAAFAQGVSFSADGNWLEAVNAFEASLAAEDRPATRANLVHAYAQLGRPLDVARHATAFLALPESPHRADTRAEIARDLARASGELSILTTDTIPAGTHLSVDGSAMAPLADGRVYLAPGLHRLEARMPGAEPEVIEIALGKGQVIAWPREGRRAIEAPPAMGSPPPEVIEAPQRTAPPPPPLALPKSRFRKRTAMSLAAVGGALELAGVGMYLMTRARAERLSERDPFKPGFLSTEDEYQRAAVTVAPLSLVGGLLCAQAIALGPRSVRWGNVRWAIAALGVGVSLLSTSALLTLRDHDTLGRSSVDAPDLQAAALTASFALPLLTYGVGYFIAGRHKPDLRALDASGRVTW